MAAAGDVKVVAVVAGAAVAAVEVVPVALVEGAVELAAATPGIVIAPIAAKTAVAIVAAAAEPAVRQRRSRIPASRVVGVGVASVGFMGLRMTSPALVFLRAGLELPVNVTLFAEEGRSRRAGVASTALAMDAIKAVPVGAAGAGVLCRRSCAERDKSDEDEPDSKPRQAPPRQPARSPRDVRLSRPSRLAV